MRKALLIMAAALMTMTQCRKQETSPATPAADTIKMTVTAGPGRTSIDTENGSIKWSAGDKLYVSDGTNWLGSLTLVGEGGSAQGTFTGSIAAIGEGVTTCHFFYLGHDNGMEEPTGTAAASISFAAQDGTIGGATKFHTGYGNTDVTVAGGEAAGYVLMNTKIAIAHFNFTADSQPYTGAVTMGGTGISNVMSVSPDGTFSGSGDGGITIDKGDGTTGGRYVTLIPSTTPIVSVAFTGDATGGMTFLAGIKANNFYGMKDAMTVTLEAASAPKFTVGMDGDKPRTVEFAPGNLWADATGETPVFYFEPCQWEMTPKTPDLWVQSHVSHFKWSDAAHAVTGDDTHSGDLFCASNFTVTGDSHTDWRTLTDDEWKNLLGLSGAASPRDKAANLCAMVTLTDVTVFGLVILPDDSHATANIVTTTELVASYGAVFLPAAGYRSKTAVNDVNNHGYYLSSTNNKDLSFIDYNSMDPYFDYANSKGCSVRLVRYR